MAASRPAIIVTLLVATVLATASCTGSSPRPSPSSPPRAYDLTGDFTMARCDTIDSVAILDAVGSVVASAAVSVPAGTACHVAFTVHIPAADHYEVQIGDQVHLTLSLSRGAGRYEWSGAVSGTIDAEPAPG